MGKNMIRVIKAILAVMVIVVIAGIVRQNRTDNRQESTQEEISEENLGIRNDAAQEASANPVQENDEEYSEDEIYWNKMYWNEAFCAFAEEMQKEENGYALEWISGDETPLLIVSPGLFNQSNDNDLRKVNLSDESCVYHGRHTVEMYYFDASEKKVKQIDTVGEDEVDVSCDSWSNSHERVLIIAGLRDDMLQAAVYSFDWDTGSLVFEEDLFDNEGGAYEADHWGAIYSGVYDQMYNLSGHSRDDIVYYRTVEQAYQGSDIEETRWYDLKDYLHLKPKGLDGWMDAALARSIYDSDEVLYDEENMLYSVGSGAIKTYASTESNSYAVFVTEYINSFTVFGLQVGMTQEEAEDILKEQGILDDGAGNFMVNSYQNIQMKVADGRVTQIIFIFY